MKDASNFSDLFIKTLFENMFGQMTSSLSRKLLLGFSQKNPSSISCENPLVILPKMGSCDICLEPLLNYLNSSNGIMSICKYIKLHPKQKKHTSHFIEHLLTCFNEI